MHTFSFPSTHPPTPSYPKTNKGDCCLDPTTNKPTTSFVIGFGPSWPNSYHHRAASCKGNASLLSSYPPTNLPNKVLPSFLLLLFLTHPPIHLPAPTGKTCTCSTQPLAHVLWGGLLGGPEQDDAISPEGCPDFIHMEVALDFNAGFTSAVAGLKHLSLQGIRF